MEALVWLSEQMKDQEERPVMVLFVLDVDADEPEQLNGVVPELGTGDHVWRIAAGGGEDSGECLPEKSAPLWQSSPH